MNGEKFKMKLKFIKIDDFINYRKCSMFLGVTSCDWKCCKENNLPCTICQNYPWSNNEIKNISNHDIIRLYAKDNLMESIVIGGLEPFLQFEDMLEFIDNFRAEFLDDIVIYTGYYKEEIIDKIELLSKYKNIIIKFGRYIPGQSSHYDDVLGVNLASNNQYAEKIS